jgi:hypothetical protein
MTLKEVLSFVDGTAAKLPRNILLRLEGDEWTFSVHPQFDLFQIVANSQSQVVLPRGPGATQVVYTSGRRIVRTRLQNPDKPRSGGAGISLWNIRRLPGAGMVPQLQTTPLPEFTSTQTNDDHHTLH